MMKLLLLMMMMESGFSLPALSDSVDPWLCDGNGCCPDSNFGPGPLNLTQSLDGWDVAEYGQKVDVFHCVENFVSFQWFKVDDNGTHVPFPWTEGDRVSLRRHNQTVQIVLAKEEDGGDYAYLASNGTHQLTGIFSLRVDCSATAPTFATKEQPVQQVDVGKSMTLVCVRNPGLCPWTPVPRVVFWVWKDDPSGPEAFLQNGTLDMVNVVCDTSDYYGQNCSVLIHRVLTKHYRGQFICRIDGDLALNQTVRLVPPVDVKVSWLPAILGVAAGVAMVMVVVVVIWWRCGPCISFWCRRLPDRGQCQYDAVIIHGDDYENLVQKLLPRLGELEYDATPGRPEVLEKTNAVLTTYRAILAFSTEELQQGEAQWLLHVLSQVHSGNSVIVLRCDGHVKRSSTRNHDKRSDNGDTEQALVTSADSEIKQEVTSDNEGEENDSPTQHDALVHKNSDNVLEDPEILRKYNFKVLDCPKSLTMFEESNDPSTRKTSREEEKFWYSLRKFLPRPSKNSEAMTSPVTDT